MFAKDDMKLDDWIEIVLTKFIVACNLNRFLWSQVHHLSLWQLQQQLLSVFSAIYNVTCTVLVDDVLFNHLKLLLLRRENLLWWSIFLLNLFADIFRWLLCTITLICYFWWTFVSFCFLIFRLSLFFQLIPIFFFIFLLRLLLLSFILSIWCLCFIFGPTLLESQSIELAKSVNFLGKNIDSSLRGSHHMQVHSKLILCDGLFAWFSVQYFWHYDIFSLGSDRYLLLYELDKRVYI